MSDMSNVGGNNTQNVGANNVPNKGAEAEETAPKQQTPKQSSTSKDAKMIGKNEITTQNLAKAQEAMVLGMQVKGKSEGKQGETALSPNVAQALKELAGKSAEEQNASAEELDAMMAELFAAEENDGELTYEDLEAKYPAGDIFAALSNV